MTATFEHIQTYTLASSQNKIQFTNLPQTFTDLVFYATIKSDTSSTHGMCRFGNSAYTASGYNMMAAFARSTTNDKESYAAFNQTQVRMYHFTYLPNQANRFGIFVLSLFNYANTSVLKTYQITSGGIGADDYAGIEIQNGYASTTSAINQIEFGTWQYINDLSAGTEISVYGIKKE